MKNGAPGAAGRGFVCTQWHALCLLSVCEMQNLGAPFQFSESTDRSVMHSKGEIKRQELQKHKIPCCANSLRAHILNTLYGSLLNSKRNNRAKNSREKRQGQWEEWNTFCLRGRVGSLCVYLIFSFSGHQIKISARHFKISQGRPGFRWSLCHAFLSK